MPLRSKTNHFSFGTPVDLPSQQLPTNRDVVNYIRLIQSESGKTRGEMCTIFKPVAEKIIVMWANEGIPVITYRSVYRKVADRYKQFQAMNKTGKQNRDDKNSYAIAKERFFEKLFDIALCRCSSVRSCKCPPENRVPKMEIQFLRDQRGPRKKPRRNDPTEYHRDSQEPPPTSSQCNASEGC